MIVDSHFHLGYVPTFQYFDISVERYLAYMDRLHLSYCLNVHSRGLVTDELEEGMEQNVDAFEQSGGRIMSYYTYNPNNVQRSIQVMERYPDRNIFKAIKLHPSIHGVYADDPRYEPAWEYAKAHDLPIMSHTWSLSSYNPTQKYSYPPLFENYIAKYPEVNLICGHAGGRYDGIMQTVKLAQQYDNVYMDTAGDVYLDGFIAYLVEHVGSDRVMFGSDGFWIDARTQLGMILEAEVPLRDKENILYENAHKLFRIENDLSTRREKQC